MAGVDEEQESSSEERKPLNGKAVNDHHRCDECEFVAEDDEALQAHRTIHEADSVKVCTLEFYFSM